MNFQNEHADKKEPSKEPQRMPIEIYASSLAPEIVREDVRFAERQAEQGVPQLESVRNLTAEHIRHTEAVPSAVYLVEKYANRISELVRADREQPMEKILESLQPSPAQTLHWQPAVSAIGAAQTDSLFWRREHGDIQSYQQIAEPKGWLHIDSVGQFLDRSARAITTEEALNPLGLMTAEALTHGPRHDNPSHGLNGMSL